MSSPDLSKTDEAQAGWPRSVKVNLKTIRRSRNICLFNRYPFNDLNPISVILCILCFQMMLTVICVPDDMTCKRLSFSLLK